MRWPGGGSAAGRPMADGELENGAAWPMMRVEIDVALGGVGETLDQRVEIGMLAGLHEAEMPLRQRERRHRAAARRAPECRAPRWRRRPARRWRSLRDPVEDDAGDAHRRIVRGKAAHDRGRRLRLPRHVEHQHDRQAEMARRDRRWRRAGRAAGGAVEQAHDAFDHDEVGAVGGVGGERIEQVARHRPAVEIDARRAGRPRHGRPDRCSPVPLWRARTRRPRRAQRRAAAPSVTVVLPAPECGAATMRPRAVIRRAAAHAAAQQLLARRSTMSPITTIAGGSNFCSRASAASLPSVEIRMRSCGVVAEAMTAAGVVRREPACHQRRRRCARDCASPCRARSAGRCGRAAPSRNPRRRHGRRRRSPRG